jgi:hypothetical protein
MNTFNEIRKLAEKARGHFELATRPNGDEYWRRKDDAPDWIEGLSRDAGHAAGVHFPDDYRYLFLVTALDTIGEASDAEDAEECLPEEVYTSNLTRWLHSSNNRTLYVDDALEEFPELAAQSGFQGVLMAAFRAEQLEVLQDVIAWFLLDGPQVGSNGQF